MEINSKSPNPYLSVLNRRIKRYDHIQQKYGKVDAKLGALRLIVAIAFIALLYFGTKQKETWAISLGLIVLAVAFVALVLRHHKIKKKITTLGLLRAFAEADVSRVTLDWKNIPHKPNVQYTPSDKGLDLKVTGRHSLLHLIDNTSTLEASNLLQNNLLQPDLTLDNILKRQAIIKSLVPRYLLLTKLQIAGGGTESGEPSGEKIISQLQNDNYPKWGKPILIFSSVLALINILLLVFFGAKWFVLPFIVYLTVSMLFERHSGRAYSRILDVKISLDKIRKMFTVLEKRFDHSAPELTALLSPLHDDQTNPTHTSARLGKIIDALSVRAYPLAHIALNALVPWDQYFTYRLESKRRELLQHFPVWSQVTAEVEAFCALAHFARLHPEYCTPDLLPRDVSKCHVATELGHPLIADSQRVVNSFSIDQSQKIAVITGSNMSGKSAFLRTIGVNLCLAQAGTVVCATGYQTSLFHLVTCIEVTDDLENGKSLFYAEIERLRHIIETFDATERDVMFIIDEILKGTNNRERIIGGKRYLQSLSDKGGFGLVSTHDLEFANLADEISSMVNFHFRESVIDGKMSFDHKIRAGRSETTNALRIMEMENII